MQEQTLLTAFTSAQRWNAFLYMAQKVLFVSLTAALYNTLDPLHFSIWATIQSTIYLTLLWLDCGMRRSVPQYAPAFSKDRKTIKAFCLKIITIQMTLVLIALPLIIFFVMPRICGIPSDQSWGCTVGYIAGMMFVIEGCIATLRILYNSYWWTRPFNIASAIVTISEVIGATIIIFHSTNSSHTLISILATKLAAGTTLTVIGVMGLIYLTTHGPIIKKDNQTGDMSKPEPTIKEFASHSLLLWGGTVIKSLSERNFMLPLITHTFGIYEANAFKVANDLSMFFCRAAVKTIGTTDASILAHAQLDTTRQTAMPNAFKQVTTRTAALCIPLLGIVTVIMYRNIYSEQSGPFVLFALMTTGYLIETIFAPCERTLEIKKQYRAIALSYAPYLLIIAIIISCSLFRSSKTSIGLFPMIALVQLVRLVTTLCLTLTLARTHNLYLPFKELMRITITTFLVIFTITLLTY